MYRFQLSDQETYIWYPEIELFVVIYNQKSYNLQQLSVERRFLYLRRLVSVYQFYQKEEYGRRALCWAFILKLVSGFSRGIPSL
jgi:hypothetical protein